MAAIRDIAIGNQYTGNPVLGGGYYQGITIDTTPLQRLATFQYYRDYNFWRQKIDDDKAAAKEIADLTAYDVTSPMKGYSDYLKGKLAEITDLVTKNPNSLNYSKDKAGYVARKKLENEFLTARRSANTSETIYNARKTAADSTGDKELGAAMLGRLDVDVNKLFKGGIENALNNTLQSTPEIKIDDYVLQDIPTTVREKIIRGANDIESDKMTFIDPLQLATHSDAIVFGFRRPFDETVAKTERFKKLSKEEQDQERVEYEVSSRPRRALQNITNGLNSLLAQIKSINPNLKLSDIPLESIPDGTLKAIIETGRIYNSQIDRINAATGEKYAHINLDDDLSESELLQINTIQKHKNTLYTEEKLVQPTDNAIQIRGQDITDRHYIRDDANAANRLKLDQDKWNGTMIGGETVKNGAMLRAERIFNDLKKLADKNGVISPKNLRQLNVEQLKYLGIEQILESDAGGAPKIVFQPLSFEKNADGNPLSYVIQLGDNGDITVMKNAKKLSDGRYEGTFDNTKSTNKFNVGTNILNEELQKAGSKELNAYLPNDAATGGVSETTSGGSRTVEVRLNAEVPGDVDISTLTDGDYKISTGKNKGKVVTIKNGQPVGIK